MDLLDTMRRMVRYNRWQNAAQIDAAGHLSEAERRLDRGAFFGSIFGTMNHLLWADRVWMSRFDGWEAPRIGIADSPKLMDEWDGYTAARRKADARIVAWADGLGAEDLAGEFEWVSGASGGKMSKPRALLLQHVFNHQTHHRGQIHAMLTAAGARPGDTDLFLMPEEA